MANRQLQGAIFKHQGTSYLVLQNNQWDSDHLKVRSIDSSRTMTTWPRKEIERHFCAFLQTTEGNSGG